MIICAGEALIDMIPLADGQNSSALEPISGGAIFNTAIALGRLGAPTAIVTGLSRDLFGRQLAQDLSANGITTDLIVYSDRPTTLAFVELQNGSAFYHFYDENTAGRLLTYADLDHVPDRADGFYFGGISLCALPAADAYAALATARAGQSVIMLDPNIRPGFIQDETAYRARLSRMCQLADIIKCSDEDLAWIVSDQGTEDARVAKFIAQTCNGYWPALLVVTRGADGVCVYRENQPAIALPAQPADVVDTVGAGDTFNAGLMARLKERNLFTKTALANLSTDDVSDAITFAARVAAITVSRRGANPPRRSELE